VRRVTLLGQLQEAVQLLKRKLEAGPVRHMVLQAIQLLQQLRYIVWAGRTFGLETTRQLATRVGKQQREVRRRRWDCRELFEGPLPSSTPV
jgi:hypothetical protein